MYNTFLLIVLAVAAVDQFCLINYVTYEEELNPIGKLLISIGGVPLFAVAKAGGTAIVTWLLIKFRHAKFAMPVVICMAIFQLWLIYFMLF
jgi:hypothetical protein